MQSANLRGILGWGVYSASSWTWCIGLFLPIIMLRLFGWPGFLVFAVPNIAGVVLFGYLFDAERCRRTLREHRLAVRLFSTCTSAYQLFFIAWLWTHLHPDGTPLAGAAIALAVWLAGLGLSAVPDRIWPWLGTAVWLGSMALVIGTGLDGLGELPATGALVGTDLALVAPAIIFGFLLCPWLDASFHRARITSGSPRVFLVFAIAFLPMILLSCSYGPDGRLLVGAVALAQITLQATFTNAVHARDAWLGGPGAERDGQPPRPIAALLPVIAILLGTLPFLAGETTYLRFLGLYGLVFPAYALLFMAPWGTATPNRTTLILLAVLLVPAGLALDRAFIGREMGYAPLAVGLVLLPAAAILLATRAPRRDRAG